MIADLKPYPEYQETGLPWLGQVPGHWEVRRLKQVARLAYGDSLPRTGRKEGTVPVFGSNGRVGWHTESNTLAPCIIVGRKGSFGKINFSCDPSFVIDTAFYVDRRIAGVDIRWLFFMLGWLRLDGVSKDSAVPGLDREDAYQRMLTLPPPDEQAAIVRFLDWANGRLDRAIRAKRKVIALLNEQKQAIIHRAVTRGLDPKVPLKPSGIPWLGDIPKHWEVLALKRVLRRLIDCEHKTAPQVDETAFRVVRTTAVRNGVLRLHGTYCTSEDGFRAWTRRGLPEPGDVIFTREAPAGEACLVPSGMRVCLGQRTVLMKPTQRRLNSQFLVHMLYAGPPRVAITQATQGSTVGHFNMADIGALTILLPPIREQDAIVHGISEQTVGLDTAISRLEREIELLREYRTRLVADVVTGKLDVRAAAAQLPDDAPPEPVEDEVEYHVEGDAEPEGLGI